jgi:2-polyprenyl-3-methyl-5-hydroxy-6-metoxy-1,4-benzoquinol methylase
MRNISEYNSAHKFLFEFRETRIKKCIRIIKNLDKGTFLDIGCSTGEWGEYWLKKGWDVFGVDIDTMHLREAENKGLKASYCDLNKDKLPFSDSFFDLIFAGEVIEHLIDTDGFINELYRCLKPGGHILITTPNLVSFENRLRMLFGIYPVWVDYRLQGSGHVRAYTPTVLKRQLRSSGFKIRKTTGNWVPFIPQKFLNDIDFPWLSFSGSLLPGLAMDIIVLARKTEVS